MTMLAWFNIQLMSRKKSSHRAATMMIGGSRRCIRRRLCWQGLRRRWERPIYIISTQEVIRITQAHIEHQVQENLRECKLKWAILDRMTKSRRYILQQRPNQHSRDKRSPKTLFRGTLRGLQSRRRSSERHQEVKDLRAQDTQASRFTARPWYHHEPMLATSRVMGWHRLVLSAPWARQILAQTCTRSKFANRSQRTSSSGKQAPQVGLLALEENLLTTLGSKRGPTPRIGQEQPKPTSRASTIPKLHQKHRGLTAQHINKIKATNSTIHNSARSSQPPSRHPLCTRSWSFYQARQLPWPRTRQGTAQATKASLWANSRPSRTKEKRTWRTLL